ncbi:MAG: PAS domain-containing protein, partial [Syntrophaceae bacterium]|nr:PAS domain-containing protein [Syntrophaceae bacterium]
SCSVKSAYNWLIYNRAFTTTLHNDILSIKSVLYFSDNIVNGSDVHHGYWEYDVTNDQFTVNKQFYNIFRTTVEEAGGYTMSSEQYANRFIHPDDISVVSTETRKAIETTDPNFSRQLEHRISYPDGEIGYISVRFYIVKDNQGRTIRIFGVNQDITERKHAEEALIKAKKSCARMLTIITNIVNISKMMKHQENF